MGFLARLPYRELFRFLITGALCFLVGIFLLYVLTDIARIHYLVSMSIALLVVNLLGWLLNRKWTFESKSANKKWEFARYIAVGLAGYGVTLLLMALLVSVFGINYLIASVIVALLMLLANFVTHRNWSFRRKSAGHSRT